ncbi:CBS domain-containing protein [Haloplanus aerogenes]|uniref:CBS domain protein n=1 Tax=Haloplanus aerogenes TaxID=660522 RepID=A0A3M0DA39_9EURY|nr:CBS domain-containing protein [Haloplanus aerogenes]AZH26068.1 CBS domain-containing protein [Haloplanus aerogenes]RMB18482.1 CBS domain protein [Haloplanus aerogenes]
MIDVPVSAVTTESVPTVPPTTTAVEAATRLRRADVCALVVRDSSGAVVGIVTESDIVAVVAEGGENPLVESFMSTPVVTVDPTTPVGLAADQMRDAGVARLPVVDGGERRSSTDDGYRGLVTRDDIAPYLSRHRLDVDWQGDPLSLDGTGTPDTVATE